MLRLFCVCMWECAASKRMNGPDWIQEKKEKKADMQPLDWKQEEKEEEEDI